MHEALAALITSIVERNYLPKDARRSIIVPLDEAGKYPTLRSSKRPIALLSTLVKLLELVLVRRVMPHVGSKIPRSQYAH